MPRCPRCPTRTRCPAAEPGRCVTRRDLLTFPCGLGADFTDWTPKPVDEAIAALGLGAADVAAFGRASFDGGLLARSTGAAGHPETKRIWWWVIEPLAAAGFEENPVDA